MAVQRLPNESGDGAESSVRLLNRKQVARAYSRWKAGEFVKRLAQEYGLSEHTMRKYLRQFEKGVVQEWAE